MIKEFGSKSIWASTIIEEVIIEWDDFVNTLHSIGCDMSNYEFENDMDRYRASIDLIAGSIELVTFNDHNKVLNILELIDNKFKIPLLNITS